MKTLPFKPIKNSNEDIASQIMLYAPEKRFDREQAEHTLRFVENGSPFYEQDREEILNLVEQHLEATYGY